MASLYSVRPLMTATCGLALAAAVMIASGLPAAAQVAPPYQSLVLGGDATPQLAEAQAGARRAEGLARQATTRPNPTMSFRSENFDGRSPYSGFDRAENTLELSIPLEVGGKRSARIAATSAEVQAARARSADSRITYSYDLALAYAGAEASDQRVERAEDEVEQATEDTRVAKALFDAGREAELRVQQSQTALGAAKAELNAASAAKIAAFARLTAVAGSTQPYASVSTSLLSALPAPQTSSSFDALKSPAYLAAIAERDAARLRVRVEQTRSTPDVTATLGLRQFELDKSTALVAGFSIPLPFLDGNRGNTDAARASFDAAAARANFARLQAQADGSAAIAQLSASEARVAAAVSSETAADEAYRLSRVAYESGRASLVELLSARRAVGVARSATIDARLARVTAEATLARLQGRVPFGDVQ